MNAAKKQSARRELENIEAALEETILACTPSELRHDLVANGDDVDAVLKEIEDVVCGAISQCAKQNLVKAKHELSEWRIARSGRSMTDDTQHLKKRFETLRNRDPELDGKMTLAARKGHGLSDGDLKGMLEDLDDLDNWEGSDGSA